MKKGEICPKMGEVTALYRVFLADADAAMRELCRGSLPPPRENFQIVGEAADGETALPMIRDFQPDILIVSLDLPFVDGLTLCREVRLELPWICILLLSGDDDPAHVRAAEALGVEEYLLRPVGAYELREAVARAAASIDRSMHALTEHILEARRGISDARREWEKRLFDWIRTGGPSDFERVARGRYCRLLSLQTEGVCEEHRWAAAGLLRLMEKLPGQTSALFAMELPRGPAMIAVGDDPERLEDFAYRIAYTTQCAIRHFTGESMHIRISPCIGSLEALRRCCLRPPDAADRPICGPGDVLRRRPGMRRRVNALADRMLCADPAEMRAYVSRLWRTGQNWSHIVAEGALHLICEVLEEERPLAPGEADQIRTQWQPQPSRERQAVQLCRALDLRDNAAPGLSDHPISRARYFLSKSYRNPGIPLHAAAREAGMPVNRFSVVFAQEMGVSFSEYLTQMRVNAAKALLTATRMRPTAVAHWVGYSDEKHFATVFQRYAGQTMREYRKIHQKP